MTPRLPPLAVGESDSITQHVFARLKSDGRSPSPLYRTLAHAPKMLEAWAAMSQPLRSQTAIAGSLRELIIMRIAQMTGSNYAWAYHREPALRSGISEHQLETLENWNESSEFDECERAVLAYAEQIVDATVDDATYQSLVARFDEAEVVEITVVAAFYCAVARVLQAFQIQAGP